MAFLLKLRRAEVWSKQSFSAIILSVEDKSYLKRINIVLVDTQDGANIGSVCRAMKTMGLEDLTLVTQREYDENRVKTLALHAYDLYENAQRVSSLDQALKDSVFTVGATRRRGKYRKLSAYSPEQLARQISRIPEGRVSIVFGRESDGLRDEEVMMCSSIVTIPTSEAFPSLNLAQSVQIIAYVMFNQAQVYPTGMTAVTHERVRAAVQEASAHLSAIGYYKWDEEKKWTEAFLGDMLERAALSESEMQRFDKLFSKIEKIKIYKDGEK